MTETHFLTTFSNRKTSFPPLPAIRFSSLTTQNDRLDLENNISKVQQLVTCRSRDVGAFMKNTVSILAPLPAMRFSPVTTQNDRLDLENNVSKFQQLVTCRFRVMSVFLEPGLT